MNGIKTLHRNNFAMMKIIFMEKLIEQQYTQYNVESYTLPLALLLRKEKFLFENKYKKSEYDLIEEEIELVFLSVSKVVVK